MPEPTPSTGRIIQFPAPRPEPSGAAALDAALARLHRSLEEQRAAIGQWRASLGELRAAASGLGDNLVAYQMQLSRLQVRVGRLDRTSREVAAWAGSMEADASS